MKHSNKITFIEYVKRYGTEIYGHWELYQNIMGWETHLIMEQRKNEYSFSKGSGRLETSYMFDISREAPKEVKKGFRNYIKGIRKLIKFVNEKPGFFDSVAWGYTGKGPESAWDYLERIERKANIISIGEGSTFVITNYVDGSIDVTLK